MAWCMRRRLQITRVANESVRELLAGMCEQSADALYLRAEFIQPG
jgi:hypothetical protein